MMNYYNTNFNSVLATINQQYSTGCTLGQQGIFAEQSGNLWAAMQSYDRAITFIQQSITLAQQSQILISQRVYDDLVLAHLSNARVKHMLGWSAMAQSHFDRAIAINPNLASHMTSTPHPGHHHLQEQTNWIETLNTVAKTMSNVFNAVNHGLTAYNNFNQQLY